MKHWHERDYRDAIEPPAGHGPERIVVAPAPVVERRAAPIVPAAVFERQSPDLPPELLANPSRDRKQSVADGVREWQEIKAAAQPGCGPVAYHVFVNLFAKFTVAAQRQRDIEARVAVLEAALAAKSADDEPAATARPRFRVVAGRRETS